MADEKNLEFSELEGTEQATPEAPGADGAPEVSTFPICPIARRIWKPYTIFRFRFLPFSAKPGCRSASY